MGRRPSVILSSGLPEDYVPDYPWLNQALIDIRIRMRRLHSPLFSPASLHMAVAPPYCPPITEREARLALIQAVVLLEEAGVAWPEGDDGNIDLYLDRVQAALQVIKKKREQKNQKPQLRLVK